MAAKKKTASTPGMKSSEFKWCLGSAGLGALLLLAAGGFEALGAPGASATCTDAGKTLLYIGGGSFPLSRGLAKIGGGGKR